MYRSDHMTYEPVMVVLQGEVNDILICRDAVSERNHYYTFLVIHDHEIMKRLLSVMEQSVHGFACCVEIFQQGNVYCAVFPHVKERFLKSFYMPAQFSLQTCGEICENLILACMLSKLPYPLLYLALEQEQVHLRKDYSVELGCGVELDELNEEIGEGECARQCARVIRELLEPGKRRESMAYRLFMKKWDYKTFGSLYRDLRLVKGTLHKRGRLANLRLFLRSHRHNMFQLLRIVCMGVIALALVSLVSRVIWGEIPFLRIFVNHFQVIGTESLTG